MTGSTSQENGGNMLNNTRPFYVGIGTGDDAVTESDYKLSNALNISLTARSQSIGGNVNKYTRFATVATTYTNNTGNAVTVKEMGAEPISTLVRFYSLLIIFLIFLVVLGSCNFVFFSLPVLFVEFLVHFFMFFYVLFVSCFLTLHTPTQNL